MNEQVALPQLIALDGARIPDDLQFWPLKVPDGIMEKAMWFVEQEKRKPKYLYVEKDGEVNLR